MNNKSWVSHSVCVRIFAGLYFCEFHKSTSDRENVYTYGTSLLPQAAICEIKITKIVGCRTFAKYTSRESLYAYGMSCMLDMHTNDDVDEQALYFTQ